MQLKFQRVDNILIASAFGELDHHSAKIVRNEIDDTMETLKYDHLIFDFKKITFMDSSGIGVVMGRYKKVSEKGGRLFLAGCSPYIEKILDMAGIFTVAERTDKIEDAIAEIKGQEQIKMEVGING